MTLLSSPFPVIASYLIQIIWSVFYLHWLLYSAWNYSAPVTSTVFFSCEIIGFISSALFLFTGILVGTDAAEDSQEEEIKSTVAGASSNNDVEQDDSSEYSRTKRATAAICLCRYNEPLEELLPSVTSMLEIKWPAENKHIYILDDGFHGLSKEKKLLLMKKVANIVPGAQKILDDSLFHIEEHEDVPSRDDCAIKFISWKIRQVDSARERCQITLIARKKPQTSHYKAGNVNNFLYNYCAASLSDGGPLHDYMLLLDHDMLASPSILKVALARFERDPQESLAFVQFPQRFYDVASTDCFYAGNEIFFDGVQVNRSKVGLAAFAGTNAVWRMSALYHIGGMQYGSLTEDAHTGYAAHRAGYCSVYIPIDVCIGQSPQSATSAMRQRMRWSQGSVEMALLSIRKRLEIPTSPPLIKSAYKVPELPTRSLWQCIVMKIVYLDSMIYPFYSIGYVLHVLTCVLYLFGAQAPMSPSNPAEILIVWMPLYIIKACSQLLAFRRASFDAHIWAQKAWAGYALTTLVSIKRGALSSRESVRPWFNTGGDNIELNSYFYLQWGNMMILFFLVFAMMVRIIRFATVEDTCQAWNTIGALTYGFIMIYYVQGWAMEPVRETLYHNSKIAKKRENMFETKVDTELVLLKLSTNVRECIFASVVSLRNDTNMSVHTDDSLYALEQAAGLVESQSYHDSSADSSSETPSESEDHPYDCLEQVRKAIENREHREKYAVNASWLVNILLIVIISCALFIWSNNPCDAHPNPTEGHITVTSPEPPLPSTFSFDADFESLFGELTLNGEPFLLKGVNWFGFETDRHMAFGLNAVSQDTVFDMLVKNGVNSIRLPLTVDAINNPSHNVHPSWAVDQNLNPQYSHTKDYLQSVEIFIRCASQWGIFVLLDMHLLRSDTALDPLPFDERTNFGDVIDAWKTLAETMCNIWSVMGADLKNEPYDATWDVWREAVEVMSAAVTKRCPSWLIFVEGIHKFDSPKNPLKTEHVGSWGSMLLPAREYPIRILNERKLIYSPHIYGSGTLGDSIFWRPEQLVCRSESLSEECAKLSKNTFPDNMPALYDLWFGFLQSELNNTIIVGEWGGTYINKLSPSIQGDKEFLRNTEVKWNEGFVEYLVDRKFGSFYWCVNPESGDTGGLLLDDWSTPDTAKLSLLRRLPSTPTLNVLISYPRKSRLRQCFESYSLEFLVSQASGPRYDYESNGYNMDFDGTTQPRGIVFPRGEVEVSHAVKCSHDNDVQVCIRSGGYSYAADSLCDGVLIDVRGLKMVSKIEESTSIFEVGSGNSMGELASKLQQYGRFTLAGNHHGVGAGWFLGCGRGWLSRSIGLGCDSIFSARVVTNDGTIVEATDDNEHKDLIWALRGAGSGNFGVVTSFKIETLTLPHKKSFVFFQFHWARDKAQLVFNIWQDLAIDHDNPSFTCNFKLWSPDVSNVELEGVLWGTEEELEKIFRDAIGVLGKPDSQKQEAFEYMDFISHAVGIKDVMQLRDPQSGWSGKRRAFRNKSHIIYDRLESEGINTLLLYANEKVPGSDAYSNYIEITPLGGAINSPIILPSAFPHRSAIAVAQYGGYWTDNNAKSSMLIHQRRFRQSMEKFWGNHAFVNYKDNELNDWEEAYWGVDAVRQLGNIKCKYDKSNTFSTMRQSIKC